MPTTTGTQILDQLLDECDGLGYKFQGNISNGVATITTLDPELNKNAADGETERFTGRLAYIPVAAGPNQVHSISEISVATATTTINTLGTYTESLTGAHVYLLSLHPDLLRRLINDGLGDEYTDAYIPLSHGPDDADMQAEDTDSWPDTSLVTVSLQTDPAEVFMGLRGKKTLFSGAGYSQNTGYVRVRPGEKILFWGIWKADVGTVTLQLVSRAGTLLDSIACTAEAWIVGYKTVLIPSNVEEVTLRLAGSANLDEGDWAAACITRPDARRFDLPSWVDERHKLRGVAKLNTLAQGYDANTFEAMDFEELSLDEGEEYRYIAREAEAHPYQMVFTHASTERSLLEKPLFLVGQRPFIDYGELLTDADTTFAPFRPIVARCKWLLGDRYATHWPTLKATAEAEMLPRALSRLARKPRRAKDSWGPMWH